MSRPFRSFLAASPLAPLLLACAGEPPPPPLAPPAPPPLPVVVAAPPEPPAFKGLDRAELNRSAVRANLPLYWATDSNKDGIVDPGEVASLLFYPTEGHWVEAGAFTPDFDRAWHRLATSSVPGGLSADGPRRALVAQDLDQGLATLVATDFRGASDEDKAFVRHMLATARLIDDLFAIQNGSKALAGSVAADDDASHSLFRRNWGPRCVAPLTEKNPLCTAIASDPKPIFDEYPADLQKDPKFCIALEKLPNAKELLAPFVAIRANAAGKPEPVPLTVAYREPMAAIARELDAAAAGILDPNEAPLKAYLTAAAQSFTTNDWVPSDEAWSRMTAQSSKWYVRVAPDETYWEPCSHKAGFHLTFARINRDSLAWQGARVAAARP